MFNIKTSAIIGGGAFILSFLISIISGTTMPVLVIRPLIFAFVFFAISALIPVLVGRFLPELLDRNSPAPEIIPPAGSRIDITEEEAPPASVRAFFGAQADDSDDGLGNISDLVGARMAAGSQEEESAAGLDQNSQDGYNENGGLEELSEPEPPRKPAIPKTAETGIPDSVDVLPDLDSMAGMFSADSAAESTDTAEYSGQSFARKPLSASGKAPEWSGDFNVRELAAGLRTVLNKEKEG